MIRKKRFEEMVKEGIMAIPERFLKKLDNVDIVIEDEPSSRQLKELKERKNSIIFGLYEGIPQTDRGNYAQVLPDKITIFKKSIKQASSSENKVKEIVKNTVWHEIAHHFGMNEKRVREAEARKRREEKN